MAKHMRPGAGMTVGTGEPDAVGRVAAAFRATTA